MENPHTTFGGNNHGISKSILHLLFPIMVCLTRQKVYHHMREKYKLGESGQPTYPPKPEASEKTEHPPAEPSSEFRQVGGTRVNPIEEHNECTGLEIIYLSSDYGSVVRNVTLEILVSNEVIALHPFHPVFAVATEKGRKILIYRFSIDGSSAPVLVETLRGHNRKITAISFSKSQDSVFQIASGDEYGNVMVHQIDLEHPHSAFCVGIVGNELADFSMSPPYPKITSIDWSGNTVFFIGHSVVWRIESPVVSSPDGEIWKITTPSKILYPPDLNAGCFKKFGVKLCCIHPTGSFLAVGIEGYREYVRSIKIFDTTTFAKKCTFESPSGVYSMRFSDDGTKLLLGCTKRTIVLNVHQNGNTMTFLSNLEVGHTRHVSSVIMCQTAQGPAVLSADLTGKSIMSKLP